MYIAVSDSSLSFICILTQIEPISAQITGKEFGTRFSWWRKRNLLKCCRSTLIAIHTLLVECEGQRLSSERADSEGRAWRRETEMDGREGIQGTIVVERTSSFVWRFDRQQSTRKKDGTDGCFSSIPRPMQPHATCRLRPTLYLGPNWGPAQTLKISSNTCLVSSNPAQGLYIRVSLHYGPRSRPRLL